MGIKRENKLFERRDEEKEREVLSLAVVYPCGDGREAREHVGPPDGGEVVGSENVVISKI